MEQTSFCIRGIFFVVQARRIIEAVLTFNITNDKVKKMFKGRKKTCYLVLLLCY